MVTTIPPSFRGLRVVRRSRSILTEFPRRSSLVCPGFPRLADGDDHDIRIRAVRIRACPDPGRLRRKRQGVRNVQGLGPGLRLVPVDQNDLAADLSRGQGHRAVRSDVAGADYSYFPLGAHFFPPFLEIGMKKFLKPESRATPFVFLYNSTSDSLDYSGPVVTRQAQAGGENRFLRPSRPDRVVNKAPRIGYHGRDYNETEERSLWT